MKSDTPRYIRFILNEDVIAFNPKATKKSCQTSERKRTSTGPNGEILKLSKTLSKEK
jgi:hypothetical protein